MANTGFIDTARRQIRLMCSRKMYLFGMILVPIFVAVFFLDLLWPGLPLNVPTAVVDLDHSEMSRQVTRSLNATELLDVKVEAESYDQALEKVRTGEVFGFFVIPANFQRDALAGNSPTLEYYSNMTYFVPGTLAFKGFKSVAVATAGGVIQNVLSSMGVAPQASEALIKPLDLGINAIGNPWMNYSYYLTPSFSMATFALMVMLMTVFTITIEIKHDTSRQWLATAHDNIWVALAGKLLPMTVIFSAVGLFILWLLFGWRHFPMNGSLGAVVAATLLMVPAYQMFAVFICSVLPNPRLAFSICSLFGILSFSFTGFSFPVEDMYGALAVFSYLAPVRYWLLIYFNEALNGYPLFFSRYYFVALILFSLFGGILVARLKRACLKPVYVP